MCNLITHNLALYVLTLSEISKNSSFDPSKVFLDRSKYSTNPFQVFGWLDRLLIPVWSIKKLKKFITKSRVDSIDSWSPFDRLKKKIQSIEGDSRSIETREIEFFLVTVFWRFTWTKHSFLITSEWDWDQNWISLMP